MESSPDEEAFANHILDLLQNRIRPREQVLGIRRQMAQQLAESLGTEQLRNPLSLVDLKTVASPSEDLSEAQKAYMQEVQRSLELQAEFARLQEQQRESEAATLPPRPAENDQEDHDDGSSSGTRALELHLEVTALQKKLQRLRVVERCLDSLGRQPAASADFADPDAGGGGMFAGCAPLPEVPRELVQGFTADTEGAEDELRGMMRRLEKTALRNKLLAERERRKYEARRRAAREAGEDDDPNRLPPEVRLHCLNAVKDGLITWIESQLSKVGGDDGEDSILESSSGALGGGGSSPSKTGTRAGAEFGHADQEAQVAAMQKEYERHIELRKEIMTLVAEAQAHHLSGHDESPPSVSSKTDNKPSSSSSSSSKAHHTPPPPSSSEAYLLTPFIQQLQAISQEQKGLMQERTHINAVLAAQRHASGQILSDIDGASELLHRYPMPSTARGGGEAGEAGESASFEAVTKATRTAGSGGDGSGTASQQHQVERWLFAADSAKIATLEAVADRAERGQLAIGEALGTLERVRGLLDVDGSQQRQEEEGGDGGGGGENEKKGGDGQRGRKGTVGGKEQPAAAAAAKTVWDRLDGNLGLINE